MAEPAPALANLTAAERRDLLRRVLERKSQQPQASPLSLGQEALWFLDQLEPGRPTYSLYPAARVRGPLNVSAAKLAVAELIRRHDTLRTCFPEVNGAPVQRISPTQVEDLAILDLSHLPEAEREAEARRIAATRPAIDLQRGPLFRPQVLRLSENEFVLTLQIHHIIFDGWSLGVMARELMVLYQAFCAGRPSPLPELAMRYGDFAAWQRQHLQGETLEQLRSFWRTQLAGLPPLDLATDYPRPAIRTSRGDRLPLQLSAELTGRIVDFSRQARVTPFMTLLAAFQELLHRYSGQEDFALGTPTANRRQKNVEPLIGYFINMLVLRADLSGDPTFRQLLQRVREMTLAAYAHQELTLDKVVEAVQPPRDMSRHPLFQVMFVLQNSPLPQLHLPDLDITPLVDHQAERTAKFELTVPLKMTPEGLTGRINFNTDLFSRNRIARMIEHYQLILTEALANPDQPLSRLPLLTEAERQTLLGEWHGVSASPLPQSSFAQLFAAQAQRTPDALAVVAGSDRWTYGELHGRVQRLARYLQQRGVGPETVVGICLPRTPELIVAVLAVWQAGGAYVPLDPAYTRDAHQRLQFVLPDAGVALVITDSSLREMLPVEDAQLILLDRDAASIQAADTERRPCPAAAENLAYILYTSGSTGQPKGVMVTQGNLLNAYQGWEQAYRLRTELTAHLQMASFGFDVFVGELLRALGSGGKLVLCPKEILLTPEALLDLMRRERVDAAEFVPVVLRTLVQHLEETQQKLEGLRLVAVGSDVWYVEDHQRAMRVLAPDTRLVNSYGLTETTIDSTYFEGGVEALPGTGIVPIGKPFANVAVYVLDAHLRPVPIGVPGELFIGGPGVTRGYLNRPELSADRFLRDPFATTGEARMCRTGDRVRWLETGLLEFLGRADNQIKIRGFRIEPGEVEEKLREHPAVAEAAVLALERSPGDLQLVAYVTGREGSVPPAAELRQFLAAAVPEYMVPATFVTLDRLPMNASGKVNRRALPAPDWSQTAVRSEYAAPRTSLEQRLAAIWSEVLTVERVGRNDNFFHLGGNSLIAIRLNARVRAEFKVELPLVTLFAAPTLAELAERIAALAPVGSAGDLPAITRRSHFSPVPISITQERYWSTSQHFRHRAMFNQSMALPLDGELDFEALQETLQILVQRHETLRTYLAVDASGQVLQHIAPELHIELPMTDLSRLPTAEREAEVERWVQELAKGRIDLGHAPMCRVHLVRLGAREHILLVTIHHVISDGVSLQLLAREVTQIYMARAAGRPSPLAELPIQYADFALWQRAFLQSAPGQRMLDYWRQRLAGYAPLKVPVDHQPASDREPLMATLDFTIPAELRRRLEVHWQSLNTTPYVFLLASYKCLLQHWTGASDITVTSNVANRRRPETQALIGGFTNLIALRDDLSGDPPFRTLVTQVQQTLLEAVEHQEVPVEVLIRELRPEVSLATARLCNLSFAYHQPSLKTPIARLADSEYRLRARGSKLKPPTLGYHVYCTVGDVAHAFRCSWDYDQDAFEEATIRRLAERWLRLLDLIADDPTQPLSKLRRQLDESAVATAPAPAAAGTPPVADAPPVAAAVRALTASHAQPRPTGGLSLVPLRASTPGTSGTPLFCIHGLGGHVAAFWPLANALPVQRPVYALQARGLDPGQPPHERIEDMAACYLHELRQVQPQGPYSLCGWSLGGLIAMEAAQQLAAAGEEPALVAMLDTHLSTRDFEALQLDDEALLRRIAPQLNLSQAELQQLSLTEKWDRIAANAEVTQGLGMPELRRLAAVCRAHLMAISRYQPQPYLKPAVLFSAGGPWNAPNARWQTLCPGLRVERVAGNHYTLLQPPHVAGLAATLERYLASPTQGT